MRPVFERLDRAKLSTWGWARRRPAPRATGPRRLSDERREIGTSQRRRVPRCSTPCGVCPPLVTERDPEAPSELPPLHRTDRPHKNLQRMIEAYALARREVREIPRLESSAAYGRPTS